MYTSIYSLWMLGHHSCDPILILIVRGFQLPRRRLNVGGNLVFAALLGAFATLLLQSIGQFFKDPLWRAIFAIVGLCGLIVMLFGRRWLLDFFRKPSPILVVAAFAILFIVVIFGPFVQQQEWPIIPFFRLQPSDRLISEQDLPTPFAKNQIIAPMAPSNNTTNVLVLYTAELTAMGDNLRVFRRLLAAHSEWFGVVAKKSGRDRSI